MKLSAAGLALLKKSEGFRSQVYNDVAAFATIGFGHRLTAHELFPQGVTLNQALEILDADVAIAETAVERLVTVPLTQGQFDALVDFVFNLGGGRLESSTLLHLLNAGQNDQAAEQLLLWDHAGHKEVEGLKRRREAEYQLWKG